uniref:Uncharacterized protein n=1 Tax=viral metagenome TaxID=1070528 RepID=A0A6M3IJW2_9ZZZZ
MRRWTDGQNGFGDVMPTATVHIRPKFGIEGSFRQPALQISNFEDLGYNVGSYAKTMMMCATLDGDAVTACMISVPACSIVGVEVRATYGLSAGAGADACSGGFIVATCAAVASGVRAQIQAQSTLNNVCTADATFTVTFGTGAIATGNAIPVVITGETAKKALWFLDIQTWTIWTQYNDGETDCSSR